jgi:hypothetical protein
MSDSGASVHPMPNGIEATKLVAVDEVRCTTKSGLYDLILLNGRQELASLSKAESIRSQSQYHVQLVRRVHSGQHIRRGLEAADYIVV